jgi:hypothetical protein
MSVCNDLGVSADTGKAVGWRACARAAGGVSVAVWPLVAERRTLPGWVAVSGTTRSRAGDMPAQFTPETRDDVTGWLWEARSRP